MMKTTKKAPPAFAPVKTAGSVAVTVAVGSPPAKDPEWEVRPCGMLVQKRNPDTDTVAAAAAVAPPLPIRVRVKHGAASHEIYLRRQSTFGELKKLLSERTGLHPQDQKLVFKGKERDSAAFLDIAGVKDRSKVVLTEDPAAQARRVLEMRRTASMEKAARAVSHVSLGVDKLAAKVSQLESIVSRGKKVAEDDINALIEQLMDQLLKLDAIVADGEVKLQRRLQVRRVQKHVESLDALKVKNSAPVIDSQTPPPPPPPPPRQEMNWGTFDLLSGPPAAPAPTAAATARLEWELF